MNESLRWRNTLSCAFSYPNTNRLLWVARSLNPGFISDCSSFFDVFISKAVVLSNEEETLKPVPPQSQQTAQAGETLTRWRINWRTYKTSNGVMVLISTCDVLRELCNHQHWLVEGGGRRMEDGSIRTWVNAQCENFNQNSRRWS